MADEQAKVNAAPAEEQVATEESQEKPVEEEQTAEAPDSGKEPVENLSEGEPKGDLRVALREERRKRQELERAFGDPNAVYRRAVELGLAAEQEGQEAPSSPAQPRQPDVHREVRFAMALERAVEKYPQLKESEDDQLAVSALTSKYRDPLQAADLYFSKLTKAKEEGKTEGAVQKAQEVTDKERAQTATSGGDTTSDAAELADLQEKAKSWDRKIQDAAMQKLLERRNKELGIV